MGVEVWIYRSFIARSVDVSHPLKYIVYEIYFSSVVQYAILGPEISPALQRVDSATIYSVVHLQLASSAEALLHPPR